MSDQSPWFSLAEDFNKLGALPELTVAVTPLTIQHTEDALSVDHCERFATFLMDLPGHLFGLDHQENISAGVLVTATLVEDFEILAKIAGRLAKDHVEGIDTTLPNYEAWLATLVRAALLDPGYFVQPDNGVWVPLGKRVRVKLEILRSCRNGKLQWLPPLLASILADQNINPPWRLRFNIASATKASAELCRRFAGVGMAQPTETDALAKPPGKPEPEFCFRRHGDGWFIRAFGKEGHFKDQKGFTSLALLIARAGKPVPMVELIALARGIPPESVSAPIPTERVEPAFDDETRPDIMRELEQLRQDIEDAKRRGDWTQADVLLKEFERLRGYLLANTQPNGKAKSFSTTSKRMAEAVRKAISRVCDALRQSGFNELADHFEAYISVEEFSYVYRPPTSVTWALL
ncbi:MAG: hypothetical protein WHT09_10890 [Thermogutta sp.]